MQRGQAIERPISIEAINVGTYELDVRVHGTEFCKVEREIERKRRLSIFRMFTIPIQAFLSVYGKVLSP